MNVKSRDPLLKLTKQGLDPEWIELNEKGYKDHGDIGYLWQFRTQAVVKYFETGRPEAYWDNMRRVGELQIELFKRFEAGEQISESYVETTSLSEFIQSLSGGCFDLIPEMNRCLKKVKADKTLYLFKLLRGLLARKDISSEIDLARTYYANKKKWSIHLTEVIAALYFRETKNFETNFQQLMKGYKAKYKYEVPEYKLIAIFPLGLVQLARHYGMDVQVQHELIPQDLIKPVQHSQ
ncbi:MAG: hypothetical protein CMM87_03720 [Rickettsiales bacterium]|nr:hypothetical protein [Rickettsiales bacterium]|tara:strand:+ start:284 stop:994 length:711 start_codon:yes stop_codon:yes gene_type:complete